MNSIFSTPSEKPITQIIMAEPPSEVRPASVAPQSAATAPPRVGPKHVGYGLPCAKCKTYYAADLQACPVCKCPGRVTTKTVSEAPVSSNHPDAVALEEEHERFLREFKAGAYASQTQSNAAASSRCSKDQNHQGGFEPAAVCQPCHDRIQERVDLMEAALHIDLKEAAKVIYDAVWSDPSDPSKTYVNAARAILAAFAKTDGRADVSGRPK